MNITKVKCEFIIFYFPYSIIHFEAARKSKNCIYLAPLLTFLSKYLCSK